VSLETFLLTAIRQAIREELRAVLADLPHAPEDRRVAATEAAAAAGVSLATLKQWAADGKVRRYGEGRTQRFSLAEVRALAPQPSADVTPGQRAEEIFRRLHG
jgi:hypothetical protein